MVRRRYTPSASVSGTETDGKVEAFWLNFRAFVLYYGVYEVETVYMVNEEKVILMTRAALYEEKSGKEHLKISNYFRHDYISLQILYGGFFATVCFVLGAVLWGACRMEYLLNNLHKMDLKSFGLTVMFLYVLVVAVYLCILYGVCSYRYYTAKKSVSSYAQSLRKISDIYAQERKRGASGVVMEDKKHDNFT